MVCTAFGYRAKCDSRHICLAKDAVTALRRQKQGGHHAYDKPSVSDRLRENGVDVCCCQPRGLLAPSPHRILTGRPRPTPITRLDLVELARICAKNAHTATSNDVARELWKVVREYRQKAADLDSGRHLARPAPRSPAPVSSHPPQALRLPKATVLNLVRLRQIGLRHFQFLL